MRYWQILPMKKNYREGSNVISGLVRNCKELSDWNILQLSCVLSPHLLWSDQHRRKVIDVIIDRKCICQFSQNFHYWILFIFQPISPPRLCQGGTTSNCHLLPINTRNRKAATTCSSVPSCFQFLVETFSWSSHFLQHFLTGVKHLQVGRSRRFGVFP